MRSTVPATGPDQRHVVVTLSGGMTPQIAVERLLQLVDVPRAQPAMIVPTIANRPHPGVHPKIAAGLFDRVAPDSVLGLNRDTALPVRRRWAQLARKHDLRSTMLGDGGWDRVEFQADSYRLDAAYMPVELLDALARIVLNTLDDDALALGFWREFAHPHTRLRTHSTDRARLDAELSTLFRAWYLLDASRLPPQLGITLVAWTDHPVAAELIGLGIRRYIDESRGHEDVGPWEHARVQASAELGHGPLTGSALLLRAEPALDAVRALCIYLADQLGCGIDWITAKDVYD